MRCSKGSSGGLHWGSLCLSAVVLAQDEDVTVRDEATAAASAAAAGLLYRLPSAAERPPAAGQPAAAEAYGEGNDHNEELRVLLTAAATPILSDEPHGLEAGSLFQLLLQILSRVRGSSAYSQDAVGPFSLMLAYVCCCSVYTSCLSKQKAFARSAMELWNYFPQFLLFLLLHRLIRVLMLLFHQQQVLVACKRQCAFRISLVCRFSLREKFAGCCGDSCVVEAASSAAAEGAAITMP